MDRRGGTVHIVVTPHKNARLHDGDGRFEMETSFVSSLAEAEADEAGDGEGVAEVFAFGF